MMQAFKFTGQRLIHAFNQTPMGYGLPAAIGAAFATGRRVVLITGDGGLGLAAAEMLRWHVNALPIKVILLIIRAMLCVARLSGHGLEGSTPAQL